MGQSNIGAYTGREKNFAFALQQARESDDVGLWRSTMAEVFTSFGSVEGTLAYLLDQLPALDEPSAVH